MKNHPKQTRIRTLDFAIIAALVSEKDLALDYLNKAEQLTGFGTITYGELKCAIFPLKCVSPTVIR